MRRQLLNSLPGLSSLTNGTGALNGILPANILPIREVASASLFDCPADGTFPDPTNCKQSFACKDGTPELVICPGLTVFNPESLKCDYEPNVDCVIPATKSTIAPRADSDTASTRRKTARQVSCPEPLAYNPDTDLCELGDLLPFDLETRNVARQAAFQCPAMFGSFPNPDNDAKYFLCVGSIPFPLNCPAGQLFDSGLGVCTTSVPTSSSSPSATPTATPSPSTEPSSTGLA